jgi:hypothetical protein
VAPCPVFYLNYNSDVSEPWSDNIESALKNVQRRIGLQDRASTAMWAWS